MILLSICIPTYNRSAYLIENITSIVERALKEQCTDVLEICISDNHSPDDTEQAVAAFKATSPVKIVYKKQAQNLGPDMNFLDVINIASGKYCWYMGDDDRMKEGAISLVLNEIKRPDAAVIYNGCRTECDINLNPLRYDSWYNERLTKKTFDLSSDADLIAYFDACRSLGGLFSFLSSLIFAKSSWDKVKYDDRATGLCYAHVFMLLSITMRREGQLKVLTEALVDSRNNDEIIRNYGRVKRFLWDIDGYKLFTELLIPEGNALHNAFVKVMQRVHNWHTLLNVRSMTTIEQWNDIAVKLKTFKYSPFLVACIARTPGFILARRRKRKGFIVE
ncbi:glycosyltransferase [Chitinophaga pendula]|uniref:glycosyltransferase family 2 protein n=1 Tax=Chitinophaga TaxID=79328 RepID=UPI000BAEF7C3|nr:MULTISPECIES: glycosyltransferase family 2 protein [Chitinophaga]ASZ10114.1 hypothetical protein CK934_03525 [Chitinophaga sp. MD30]UCJ06932.1 glycosyltransferase [Chitinophaga pendula]